MWYNGSTVEGWPSPTTKEHDMKTRSALYLLAQILGDVNSVSRKSIGRRVARRSLGRFTGKTLLRRLVRR